MKAYRNSNHGMEFSHCMLLKFDDSEVSGTLFFTAVFFNEDIFIPCASHDFLVGLAFMSFPVDWRWSRQWMDTDSLLKLPSFWLQYIPCSFFYCCRWRVSRVFIPREDAGDPLEDTEWEVSRLRRCHDSWGIWVTLFSFRRRNNIHEMPSHPSSLPTWIGNVVCLKHIILLPCSHSSLECLLFRSQIEENIYCLHSVFPIQVACNYRTGLQSSRDDSLLQSPKESWKALSFDFASSAAEQQTSQVHCVGVLFLLNPLSFCQVCFSDNRNWNEWLCISWSN